MAYRLHEPIDVDDINLSYFCRHCKQKVRGTPLTDPQFHISPISDTKAWFIVKCPTKLCELSFVIYDKLNDRVQAVYPYPTFNAEDYHDSIPDKVREDLAEAERCFYADAYKGTVTMYRRAIQNIVLHKIKDPAIKQKKLLEQIDELLKSGLITKDLQATAHEIRHFGNFGAHPSDDALDNTSREDAEIIGQLAFDLVRTIYITPDETAKLKAKRISK